MTTAAKKPGRLFEIGHQIDLPLRKIGEIAWRNMKHRFGRSIVTTSGVILATAFLMAMLIKNSMVSSLLDATRSLKSVQLNKAVEIEQAQDILTVLKDQESTFSKELEEAAKVLNLCTATQQEFAADVAQEQTDLAKLETAPGSGVAQPGKESDYKRRKDFLVQHKRDLQTIVTEQKKAQEEFNEKQAIVTRTKRLLETVKPGPIFSTANLTPQQQTEIEEQVQFLQRLGKQLESELQNKAIEDTPTRGGPADAQSGAAPGDAPSAAAAAPAASTAAASGTTPAAESKGEDSAARGIWLTSLALIVAGVGITNAMLMSVTERFREIGTMKCLGALDGFIMKLFLIESAVQGGMGTLLGMVIGTLMMVVYLLINFKYNLVVAYWPWPDFGRDLLVAFAAGVVISVVGAAFPSLYASRMDPIAAMRQEI